MKKLSTDIPFGWKRRKGIIIMSEIEQWILKRIMDEKESGKSLEDISRDLMRIGIKPRNGGEWFPRRIVKILDENNNLGKTLNAQTWANQEVPISSITNNPSPNRTGKIIYEIKESLEAIEKCETESEHRSLEVGKIVTYSLLHTVIEKHQKKQHVKGSENELQNWNLCESEH